MAVTANQLAVALFDAAVGGYESFVDAFIYAQGEEAAAEMMIRESGLNAADNGVFAYLVVDKMTGNTLTAAQKEAAADILVGWLAAGQSRGDVVLAAINYLASDEAAADATFGDAAMRFQNKVTAADLYEGTSTDVAELVSVIAGVTEDPTTVPGEATGNTFTLTTGVDSIAATDGADTILGSNDVNGTGDITFNIGDNIDGGAGTDTLVVANDASSLLLNAKTVTNVENFKVVNGDANFAELNLNNKAFDTVTVDYAGTDHSSDLYIDGIKADTDLVVENVSADSSYVYRNYDEVFSTLTGSVEQNNTFNNIDYSADNGYFEFDNYSYFTAATELNLTTTLDTLITGGDSSTGSDETVYLYNYVDLTADNATVNLTYNLTDVEQADSYTEIYAYVENEAVIADADVVNVEINADNVDGLYVDIDTENSGVSSDNDTFTLNVADGGLANSNDSNYLYIDDFETVNLTIDGDADIGDVDNYDNVDAAQTINIVANANLTAGTWDEADDQEVTVNISGAGDVTIDFNGDNYGFTLNGATATGDLDLEVGSNATYALEVTTGSGDDTVTLLNAFELNVDSDAFLQVLDGGDGTDTFEIDAADLVTSQALLNTDVTDFSDAIMNFERLSLTTFTTQDIDGTTLGFNDITIDGYTTTGSLTMEDEAAVTITGAGTTDLAIVIDGAATGDQSVSLTVSALATTDNTNSGLSLVGLDVSDVEAISIASISADDATEVADETENDVNVLDLVAAEATTITVSGDSALDLSGTLTALETVDAADFDAGLTIDVSSSGEAVTITVGDGADDVIGSDQDDDISVGNGGNTVEAGLGLDTITLGSGATADDVDTIVFGAVADSQGTTVDVINGFQVDVQATTDTNSDDVVDADDVINDVLDFSALGIDATANYLGEANGYGAVLTSLTDTVGDAVLDSSTSTLYIDVDGSGTLDDADMAINLVGVTDLSDLNFLWAVAP